jgi:hypothetical protein
LNDDESAEVDQRHSWRGIVPFGAAKPAATQTAAESDDEATTTTVPTPRAAFRPLSPPPAEDDAFSRFVRGQHPLWSATAVLGLGMACAVDRELGWSLVCGLVAVGIAAGWMVSTDRKRHIPLAGAVALAATGAAIELFRPNKDVGAALLSSGLGMTVVWLGTFALMKIGVARVIAAIVFLIAATWLASIPGFAAVIIVLLVILIKQNADRKS